MDPLSDLTHLEDVHFDLDSTIMNLAVTFKNWFVHWFLLTNSLSNLKKWVQ